MPARVNEDTYPAPPDGWVCFHCGERFLLEPEARRHFGMLPSARPACSLSAGELRAALLAYRRLEALGLLPEPTDG